MGASCSSGEPEPHALSAMDEELARDHENFKNAMKVLLLGSGESGKSTIFKQMKILHLHGFSTVERVLYIPLIRANTMESIRALCFAAAQLQLAFVNESNVTLAANILQLRESDDGTPNLEIRHDIKAVWHDPIMSTLLRRQNEYNLLDSAHYLLDHIDRIFDKEYLPIDQDILRSRVATTGIIETSFWLDSLQFRMYDVGGQRGERKKWIHCFDSVTAVLFIASLSEFDQVLAEDRSRNRLVESLDLFEGIVSLPWFREVPIILFLNKQDIFAQKIMEVDIAVYFNNFTGSEHDYKEGLAFIQESYLERNTNSAKTIYCHITDATNTENIAFVWKATKHIILEQNLSHSGLLMV